MSTTTTFDHSAEVAVEKTPQKGFFARLIEARTRRAESRVRWYLAGLTDRGLADLGFTPEEVRSIRKNGVIPSTFWK